MPIQLTTPVTVGALDPQAANGQYTQVRICNLEFDFVRQSIALHCIYGNTVGGDWISGKKDNRISVSNSPPLYNDDGVIPDTGNTAYDDVIATAPTDDTTPLYTQVGDALYQWLIDSGYFAGTVVA
jgi:hypothetical protein